MWTYLTTTATDSSYTLSSENFSILEMCPILGRKRKSESQLETLKKSFKADPYPGKSDKDQLAKSLNISKNAVYKWFRVMRSKSFKKGLLKKSE